MAGKNPQAGPQKHSPKPLPEASRTSAPAEPDPNLKDVLEPLRSQGIPWCLLLRVEDSGSFSARPDDAILRLQAELQLSRRELPPALALSQWEARGWGKEPHWLLASSEGEVVGEGPGLPDGDAVITVLRDRGTRPRWEERRAFLAVHPENGEAWSEDLQRNIRLAVLRIRSLVSQGKAVRRKSLDGTENIGTFLDDPEPQERERLADQVFQEAAEALEGLHGVDRWWDDLRDTSLMLPLFGAQDSPRIRQVARAAVKEVEGLLARVGPDHALEVAWNTFRTLGGMSHRELPEAPSIPGEPGPSPFLLESCVKSFIEQKDWDGALGFLDALPEGRADGRWTPETWRNHCLALAVQSGLRIRPLWELGRTQASKEALEAMRAQSGSAWPWLSKDSTLISPAIKEQAFFQELSKTPDPGLPALPDQGPSPHLAILGDPTWRKSWEALWKADPFLPWRGEDVGWSTLAPEAATRLRAQAGWNTEPRWALLRGEEVLATGVQCPRPEAMAELLARWVPSRLQELSAFLERHPGHAGARRARMAILAARMPEPRLEPLLAEDARLAFHTPASGLWRHPLAFGPDAPWKPDPALWQWSAEQVLPRIETLLRSWPRHGGLWKAWLAWSRFHPSHPSVTRLASSLDPWPPRTHWLGALPPEVWQAVTAELRRGGDYGQIVEWLGEAWAGVDQSPGSSIQEGLWEHVRAERERLLQTLVAPLAEAYRIQKRPEDAAALEATYQLMMKR